MSVQFADYVCDNGLSAFATADAIYLCSQRPSTFFEAATAYAIGFKKDLPGTLFTLPIEGMDAIGRAVVSSPVIDGQVFNEGLAQRWAAVDTTNARLIASGTLQQPILLKPGQTFNLSQWVITQRNDLLESYDYISIDAFIKQAPTIRLGFLGHLYHLSASQFSRSALSYTAPVVGVSRKNFTTNGLTLVSPKVFTAPALTETAPITIGSPVAIYAPSPALNINDTTNANTTFRVVVPITQAGQQQLRVTIKPGSVGDLTIIGLGVGEYVDASPGSTTGPILEGTFGGQHGFVAATTPKTSDWIDISSLDLQIGDKVVVTFTTGSASHASLSYNASQTDTTTYWRTQNFWSTQDVSGLNFNTRANTNLGVLSIETRTYHYFPASFDSTFYTFDSTELSFDNFAGPDVVGLLASSVTKTAPTLNSPGALAQTSFVIAPIIQGTPAITDLSVSQLGVSSFMKAPPTFGAPTTTEFFFDFYIVPLTNGPPTVGDAAPHVVVSSTLTRTPMVMGAPALVMYAPSAVIPTAIVTTRSNAMIGAPPFAPFSVTDTPVTYAEGQTAPPGFHWEFVTTITDGSRVTTDALDPIVELVAD